MLHTAYLGLGTNLGDRQGNLNAAIKQLSDSNNIYLCKISDFYDTVPVGYVSQPNFLNAALKIKTSLTPVELLKVCNIIEIDLKRHREMKWGPRTIDIDILIYEQLIINTDALTIPHPEMHKREFVLKPLMDLEPLLMHPVYGKTIQQLYGQLTLNVMTD